MEVVLFFDVKCFSSQLSEMFSGQINSLLVVNISQDWLSIVPTS